MSYLASSDRERMCRQLTTAPASVPESGTTKIWCQSFPIIKSISITFNTHFQFIVAARYNLKGSTSKTGNRAYSCGTACYKTLTKPKITFKPFPSQIMFITYLRQLTHIFLYCDTCSDFWFHSLRGYILKQWISYSCALWQSCTML